MKNLIDELRKMGINRTVRSDADHIVWLAAADVDRVGEAALEQLGLKPVDNAEQMTLRHINAGNQRVAFRFS